jgi:hypothetical protein
MSLVYLKFSSHDLNKHGGIQRSEQILKLQEVSKIVTLRPQNAITLKVVFSFLNFLVFLIRKKFSFLIFRKFSFQNLFKVFQTYYYGFTSYKAMHENERLDFITDFVYGDGWFLVLMAKFFGFYVIVYPHNIESLVPSQPSIYTNKISPNWFKEEIKILKQTNEIYVIAREEMWLLRCLGLQKVYYQPFEIDIEKLSSINRTAVHDNGSPYYVIFGTAHNLPTEIGMIEFLNYFENKKLNADIIIAGFGTNRFKNKFMNPRYIVKGTVSDYEYYGLISNAKGVIIHQAPTSGTVTKVSEYLHLGIPMFLNYNSARNNWNRNNIFYYDELSELDSFLLNF